MHRSAIQRQGAGSGDRDFGRRHDVYQDYFDAAPSTGYETLIYDCMIGDAILFQRADGVEAGWSMARL